MIYTGTGLRGGKCFLKSVWISVSGNPVETKAEFHLENMEKVLLSLIFILVSGRTETRKTQRVRLHVHR